MSNVKPQQVPSPMKNIDQSTELTIEWAKLLVGEMQSMGALWKKAFLRAEVGGDYQKSNGSFVLQDEIRLSDVRQHRAMFAATQRIAEQLREATANDGRKFCVALLIVDSEFNYEIQYEYNDSTRWAITKLEGASGVPAGYVA